MSFNGNEGEFITLEEGAAMTARYRETIELGGILGEFIGKNKLIEILEQSECVGIRIYYGINDHGKKSLVFVGADSDTNDLSNGLILDKTSSCPSICSKSNALNS